MNAKLEETKKLSEEKYLPFEYVKQMLEFVEGLINENTLEKIGFCIGDMMDEKIRKMTNWDEK